MVTGHDHGCRMTEEHPLPFMLSCSAPASLARPDMCHIRPASLLADINNQLCPEAGLLCMSICSEPVLQQNQIRMSQHCHGHQMDSNSYLSMRRCSLNCCAGLYELSQYAFLADRNGGEGLTWAKLHDPGCGMITVWGIFAAEWALFMFNAWYLDQVSEVSQCRDRLLPLTFR